MLDAVVDPGVLTGEVIYRPEEGDPVDLLSLSEAQLKQVRWEEVAFLIQAAQSAFNPTMTIKNHFVETLDAHDSDIADGLDRGRGLLDELNLDAEQVLSSYPHELSGGMKQRALVALSLLLEPEVLVMDEPTSALDLLMQRSIVSLLTGLKEEYGLTLVFVTHDLPIVADIADRLAVMYAFEVVESGPTARVTENAAHPYTRALIRSVPGVYTPLADMEGIPGESPDPVNIPQGCSYHPRCPLADAECRSLDPPLGDLGEDHEAACHHWEDASEAIPLGNAGEHR
jgi:oligopeptide/dipeptide ABC transporter ATP-binding protein